ncbi:MAG: hypothetical protein MN733_37020 [Nitrososphaera sp.]|nr:hypothetical protein [Nitrososphaera sp.]
MSETGLYSGLYEQLHDSAKIVDELLMNVKTGASNENDPSRQQVAALIDDIMQESSTDLPTKLMILAIRDKKLASKLEWSRVKVALLSHDPIDTSTVELLEKLAWALEQEQIGAMERIGGKGR